MGQDFLYCVSTLFFSKKWKKYAREHPLAELQGDRDPLTVLQGVDTTHSIAIGSAWLPQVLRGDRNFSGRIR